MAFNMNDYEPVADRIAKFWKLYPNGRIYTELVVINEVDIVIKASVYKDETDARPVAIDYAQETRGASPILKTSFVEVCSTSAIGRALATMGISASKNRASREEMQKVTRAEPAARDFNTEAQALFSAADLDGLRTLYLDAQAQRIDADTLKVIQDLAVALKGD